MLLVVVVVMANAEAPKEGYERSEQQRGDGRRNTRTHRLWRGSGKREEGGETVDKGRKVR